jgi:hypothetical protein
MCIIQNMLWYYIDKIVDADYLKPMIMKLTYIGKRSFNINGTTIHLTLVIPLNKKLQNLMD